MRALAFPATLILVGVAPAGAQTFAEAVRANMAIAIQLCEAPTGGNMQAWVQRFRDAGFAERVDGTGSGDTTHWFTAPAETVTVELYYGHMPEHCNPSSVHMGVGLASQLLDALIPQLYPGYVRTTTQGVSDPATGSAATCVRYEDPTNPIGHVVGVASKAGDGCVEDGTSLVFSSYRV